MKRLFILLVLLFLSLALFAAEEIGMEEEPTRYIHASTALVLSNYGVSWEQGQGEFDATLKSAFPNLFLLLASEPDYDANGSKVPRPIEDYGVYLLYSLSSFGVEGFYRYDVLKSEKHDLDFGLGAVAGLIIPNANSLVLGAFLESDVRYTYNLKNGGGIFVDSSLPLLGVLFAWDKSGYWCEGFNCLSNWDTAFILSLFTGTSIGYRTSF